MNKKKKKKRMSVKTDKKKHKINNKNTKKFKSLKFKNQITNLSPQIKHKQIQLQKFQMGTYKLIKGNFLLAVKTKQNWRGEKNNSLKFLKKKDLGVKIYISVNILSFFWKIQLINFIFSIVVDARQNHL